MRPGPHPGLRLRAAIAWGAGALLLSFGLSVVAYQLVRTQLVEDRQDRATGQAYVNARAVRNALRTPAPDLNTILGSLSTNARSTTLAWVDGQWFAGSVGAGPGLLPGALEQAVAEGDAGSQIVDVGGVPSVVVGVPIVEADARYYEMIPLDDIDRALSGLARGLALAATIATVGAAVAGWFVSRKVLSPVRTMAAAAERITDGDLSARLDAFGDPELEPLQRSFNEMADTVQGQIERERRFASDVSHELRTPLTAMLASVQIARRRIADPVAAEQALDDLTERGEAFRDLVLDLLEISRIDAGVADLVAEPIDAEELVRAVLVATGDEGVPVNRRPGGSAVFVGDKRRIGQVLQNLLENAHRYGGGPTTVGIERADDSVVITVDDDGPGIPPHETTHIFNRFARGRSSAGSSEGSGLGLALVSEHVKLHGGSISVETTESGGARFRVAFPAASTEEMGS